MVSAIGEPKALIHHNCDKYGWEVPLRIMKNRAKAGTKARVC